ncbi:Uncharacterised protein [Sphingobacterium spiritivorum]|uniref:Uncharacterized protein n=1 Tax=Sphingobacterium spiritivorum TaxID=258 RepID=A0A380BRR9_SPHSI|nr:hypothetical protein [Sphingobacterium spiritivorum]SUJ04701.1 Uncharacterised protein [Sphingobacterium spiritivorum]
MPPYNIHIISKGETIQRITDLVNIKGHGILHYERSKKDFMNEAPFKLIVEESPVFNNAGDFRLRCYMNL